MRPMISLLVGVLALGAAGCSTMASYETIAFESLPEGAEVVVQCGSTRRTTLTPGHVLLPRRAPDCLATIRKEGFAEERVWLRSNAAGTYWASALAMVFTGGGVLVTSDAGGGIDGQVAGEIMITGLVPWIVNLATCNLCDHDPPELKILLRPLPAQAANEASRP